MLSLWNVEHSARIQFLVEALSSPPAISPPRLSGVGAFDSLDGWRLETFKTRDSQIPAHAH